MQLKRILSVAGSDSGGGAGIQADLKTISVLGGYGMSVITALTAQNTIGVQGIREVPVDFVALQMESVLSDIGVDAVKTGMLANPEIVRQVAAVFRKYGIPNLVVDPVMVAASGDVLLAPEALDALKTELLPQATLLTPNLPEAALLTGMEINDLDDMHAAARRLHAMGAQNVLIKGGHNPERADDLFYDGRRFTLLAGERIQTENIHGTGCTLSAALATFLAQGDDSLAAARKAKRFIEVAIRNSISIGAGHGPTNPYAWIAGYMAREAVLAELSSSLRRLLELPLGDLIPEIRSNLGYALPEAAGPEAIAAVPGRITQVGRRLIAFAEPAFGASRHVARVILAVMEKDPQMRSAINIKYTPAILAACREAGLAAAAFDRAQEPRDVKEREGATLEWGTRQALKGRQSIPDLVYDLGDVGKEPVIRLLGRSPAEVLEKLLRLGRKLELIKD